MSEVKTLTTVEPSPPPAITPMEMLQKAVEQNVSLDKLEKLMDLQERWEKNEARKAFVVALADFKSDPPTIRKNKRASFDGRNNSKVEYEYLDLSEAVNIIAPALSEHGLSHNWSVQQSDRAVSVTCTLTHRMGHSESVTLTGPVDDSGSKNAIQAIGSATSYLERYSLLAVTGLAAGAMDNDGGTGGRSDKINVEQLADLESLMEEVNADRDRFLAWLNVENLEDLRAEFYPRAVKMLQKKGEIS